MPDSGPQVVGRVELILTSDGQMQIKAQVPGIPLALKMIEQARSELVQKMNGTTHLPRIQVAPANFRVR